MRAVFDSSLLDLFGKEFDFPFPFPSAQSSPFRSVLSNEVDLWPLHALNPMEVVILKQLSPFHRIVHVTRKMTWPLSDRDQAYTA